MCTKENITGYIALLDTAGIEYTRDVPLAPRTTLRIGGNADVGVFPDSEKQIAEAIRDAKKCGARYMVLGNGSNVLFDDAGFRGAVIFYQKASRSFRGRYHPLRGSRSIASRCNNGSTRCGTERA